MHLLIMLFNIHPHNACWKQDNCICGDQKQRFHNNINSLVEFKVTHEKIDRALTSNRYCFSILGTQKVFRIKDFFCLIKDFFVLDIKCSVIGICNSWIIGPVKTENWFSNSMVLVKKQRTISFSEDTILM